jgi:tetratricopeptide (TPR) repeat protein
LALCTFVSCTNSFARDASTPESSVQSAQTDYVASGNKLLEQNDYKAAIAEYDKALKLNSNELGAHSGRAIAFGQLGDYKNALASYNLAIQLDGKSAHLFYGRGAVLVRMHNPKEAIQSFDEALKLEPTMAHALYSRAGEYCNLLEFEKAVVDYNSTLKTDPNYIDALRDRGLTFFQMGEYERARDDFDRFCRVTETPDPQLIMYSGFASLLTGRTSDATNEFQQFIRKSKEPSKDVLLSGYCAAVASKAEGNDTRASAILDEAAAKVPSKDWPYPLIQYIRGQQTIDGVLSAVAGNKDQLTEARFYIGLDLSFKGKREALQEFRWVVDSGNNAFLEYGMARDELAKLHQKTLDRALYKAIYASNNDKVKELLDNGADVKSGGEEGNDNTLITATIHENPELVTLFLDRGIKPDAKLSDGRTALYFAAMDVGHSNKSKGAELARILLDRGASVNASDEFGITPLMNAARTHNVPAVKLLIERHADVNRIVTSEKIDAAGGQTVAKKGDTALSMAKDELKYEHQLDEFSVDVLLSMADELKYVKPDTKAQIMETIALLEQAGAK